ncbi:hypothetical protein HDU96_000729 [Phlyctochytrium bullatum]|nr:hypothetical protein HDU96_000729 [Phlyctochytrium bullatum]
MARSAKSVKPPRRTEPYGTRSALRRNATPPVFVDSPNPSPPPSPTDSAVQAVQSVVAIEVVEPVVAANVGTAPLTPETTTSPPPLTPGAEATTPTSPISAIAATSIVTTVTSPTTSTAVAVAPALPQADLEATPQAASSGMVLRKRKVAPVDHGSTSRAVVEDTKRRKVAALRPRAEPKQKASTKRSSTRSQSHKHTPQPRAAATPYTIPKPRVVERKWPWQQRGYKPRRQAWEDDDYFINEMRDAEVTLLNMRKSNEVVDVNAPVPEHIIWMVEMRRKRMAAMEEDEESYLTETDAHDVKEVEEDEEEEDL